MAELYFKVKADLDKVIQLRNEIEKLKTEMAGIDRAMNKSGFDNLNKKLNQTQKEFDGVTAKAAKAGATLKTVDTNVGATANGFVGLSGKLAGLVGGAALAGFASQIVTVRGEFQQLEIAFTTLLQSKDKADKLMSQMVETAAKTPFDLQGVANGARSLLAYGFEADKVNDTLIRLGNVASGLGLPLERLTYLYGTTMVQGRLYSRDMLQFTSSGIPILKEMAAMMGKSTEEIQKMVSEGKIGFPEVEKVIERMTNKGGKFYNLMEEQSKSLTGQIANLKDSISIAFNEMGKETQGFASTAISVTSSLVKNYESVGKAVAALVLAYGSYKAAMIIAALMGATDVTVKTAQTAATIKATLAQLKLNAAMMLNPYVLLGAAVAGTAYVLIDYATKASAAEVAQKLLNEQTKKASENTANLASETETLVGVIKDETSTTYDRLAALERLQQIAPKTFSNLDIEAIKRGDLLSILTATKQELQQIAILQGDNKLAEITALYNKINTSTVRNPLDEIKLMKMMGKSVNPLTIAGFEFGNSGMKEAYSYINLMTKQQNETKAKIAESNKMDAMSQKEKVAYLKEQNVELKKQQDVIKARKANTAEQNAYNKKQVDELQTRIDNNMATIKGKPKGKPTGGAGAKGGKPDVTNAWDDEIKALNDYVNKQEIITLTMYKNGFINDEAYQIISQRNLQQALENKIKILKRYKQDTTELEKQELTAAGKVSGLTGSISAKKIEGVETTPIDKEKLNEGLSQYLEYVDKKRKAEEDLDAWFEQQAEEKKQQLVDTINLVADMINALGDISQSVGDVVDSFGGDTRQLDNVTKLIGGVATIGQGAAKIAAGDWVGGIRDAVKGIADVIVSITSISDTERQKEIEQYQEKIDTLGVAYENLERNIDKAYSSDASDLIRQNNIIIEQQKDLIRLQIAEEEAKKKTDKEKIKAWNAQLDALGNRQADNKEKALDAIMGEDIKSAIDSFANAYMDAWASGSDKAKASKDLVKDMIKKMIVEALKMDLSKPMENIRKKLEEFWTDGNISASEEDEINKMMALATNAADQKYAWADRFMKDAQAEQGAATKGSWETISSEQASELSGRFTAMQMSNQEIVNETKKINLNTTETLSAMRQGNAITDEIRLTNNRIADNIALIAGYTRVLPEISQDIKKVVKNTENL